MLTPQEVQEQTFDKAVFGGYDMGCVDDFLEPLTQDYITLYKENAVLKSKLKILVEKLEEYRSQEVIMKNAMLTAQKTADNIIEEAQRKAVAVLSDAETVACSKSQSVQELVAAEDERVDKARLAAASFIEIIEKDVARHLELLSNLKKMDLTVEQPKAFDFEKPVTVSTADVVEMPSASQPDVVAEISESIGRLVDDGDMDATRVVRRETKKLPELQFGKNYDPANR